MPQEDPAVGDRNSQPFATGTVSREPQEEATVSPTADPAVKDDVIQGEAPFAWLTTQTGVCCSSQHSSGRDIATSAAGRRKEGQASGPALAGKAKPNGHGDHVGYATPIPNWKRYPLLFKDRVDRYGNWLGGRMPRCPKCDANLQPKESHDSFCTGYVPKLPQNDIEYREVMADSMHEELRGRRKEMRDERLEGLYEATIEDFEDDDDMPTYGELEAMEFDREELGDKQSPRIDPCPMPCLATPEAAGLVVVKLAAIKQQLRQITLANGRGATLPPT